MRGPDKSDAISFDEMQRVLRLALELRELPRGSQLQKRRALEGMAALVGAQVALWLHVDGITTGNVTLHNVVDLGWSGDAERNVFVEYIERGQWLFVDPAIAPMARFATTKRTFLREELVGDRAWYSSEHVQRFRRRARVDSFIYATHATGSDSIARFSLHRTWGERPFSEHERRLIDLFHSECVFLHEQQTDLSPAILRGLTPRLRETLRGLVRGQSEKQLAAEAGLSPHTVHDHVKALHRHFGVQSRSELLARCLAGH